MIVLGVMAQVRPVAGNTVIERAIVPVNPFTLVAITAEEPLEPATDVTEPGLATKLKLWTA